MPGSSRPSAHPGALARGALSAPRAPSIPAEYREIVDKAKAPRRPKKSKVTRAEAPEAWDTFQLRHCLLMLLAMLLELVFPSGFIALGIGVASLIFIFARLRREWKPPGALDGSVRLSLLRLAVLLPIPLAAPLDAWTPAGLLLLGASALGGYVVFRERIAERQGGFALAVDQEISALALALAAGTMVGAERLWGWALWLGALRYLYMVGIRALGTTDQIEASTAGRYMHAGTGVVVTFALLPGQHVVLVGTTVMVLGFIYARACFRAMG